MAIGFESGKAALALNPKPAFCITSAANSVLLPQSEPRAMREHLVVSSIRSRDVGCAEWPRIRRFEHFLYLLDIVNNAFNVHASQSSITKCEWVKRKRDWSFFSDSCIASPCAGARNEHALLLPAGTEYHVDIGRIRPQRLDAGCSDRSARSDILLRQEPDEEEEEDDEEDEGNVTDDEGDDEEEDGGGYSMQVCHLGQW